MTGNFRWKDLSCGCIVMFLFHMTLKIVFSGGKKSHSVHENEVDDFS